MTGNYFAFKTGGNPSEIVAAVDLVKSEDKVTAYQNGSQILTLKFEDSKLISDNLNATVTANGDIEWSNGLTMRKLKPPTFKY